MSEAKSNLKAWLLSEAAGEAIEGVVIGEADCCYGDDDENNRCIPRYTEQPRGKLLSWDEAAPWLDYQFYSGYGAGGCNAVYAWTATKLITIGEYDGATSCQSTPRHPTACLPEYR